MPSRCVTCCHMFMPVTNTRILFYATVRGLPSLLLLPARHEWCSLSAAFSFSEKHALLLSPDILLPNNHSTFFEPDMFHNSAKFHSASLCFAVRINITEGCMCGARKNNACKLRLCKIYFQT